jgi:hypothetical protein
MPTNFVFRGDSPPIAQITKVTPLNVVTGDTFFVSCNGKSVNYVAQASTVADVVAGLVAALQSTSIPEFGEFLASSSIDGTYLTLVATTSGVPFEVTASTTGVSNVGTVTVTEQTKGVLPFNEVWQVKLIGAYTGGTFTLTVNVGGGNVTTGNIAYNATAATVQAALVALAGVGAGQVVVTGGPGPASAWFVTWTGTLGGTLIAPGTVNGALLTGAGAATIAETTAGNGLSDDIQYLTGTAYDSPINYTLTLDGQTTAALNTNSAAPAIQSALQALPNIGAGNVLVHGVTKWPGSNNLYNVIHFTGALAGLNASTLTVTGWSSPNNPPTVIKLQNGGQTSADDFQWIDLGGDAGSFTVTYSGATTSPISSDEGTVPAAALQVALQALPGIGANNALVYATPNGNISGLHLEGYLVRFIGAKANTRMQLMTVSGGGPPTVTRVSQGQANTNESQTITIFGTGGTFTLTAGAQTTSALAWNISTGTLQTRIQTDLAASWIAVTVSGAGTLASPFLVTATNPSHTPIALMTGNGASLTGGGGTITQQTAGAAGISEVQLVTLSASIVSGSFQLSFNGASCALTAFNALAATLQTNLQATSTINTVTVSGSAGGPYTVTWSGTQANAPQPLLVWSGGTLVGPAGTQTLTVSTTTFSSGPHHWNDPLNWVGGRVPDTAGYVYFEAGADDCLYGLDQICTFTANAGTDTITFVGGCNLIADQIVQVSNAGGGLPGGLAAATNYYLINVDRNAKTAQLSLTSGGAAIDITTAGTGTQTVGVRLDYFETGARFTGNGGLPRVNGAGYYEYRAQYLHFGLRAAGTKQIVIGTGDGSGSQRLKLDTDVDQVIGKLIASGGQLEAGIPAVLWRGSNAANTWNIVNGDFGAGIYAGEVAIIAGPFQQRAGSVELGLGCVLTGVIDKTGGTLRAENATINGVCLLA